MKRKWQAARKAAGKSHYNPNIVMNSAVQVCAYLHFLQAWLGSSLSGFSGIGWEKAARYLDIEEKYVYCTKDRYVIDPKQVRQPWGKCSSILTLLNKGYRVVR